MSDTRDIIIYESQEGDTKLEVNLQEETVWLTQEQLSLLFNKDVRTVSEHITNIYEEGELDKKPTIRKFRIVRKEGNRQVKRNIQHYNRSEEHTSELQSRGHLVCRLLLEK